MSTSFPGAADSAAPANGNPNELIPDYAVAMQARLGFSAVTALGTTGAVAVPAVVSDAVVFTCTPTADMTITAPAAVAGCGFTIVFTTSGTSSFTMTFTTRFKTTGTLATGTSSAKVFTMQFVSDGTNWNEIARTVAM